MAPTRRLAAWTTALWLLAPMAVAQALPQVETSAVEAVSAPWDGPVPATTEMAFPGYGLPAVAGWPRGSRLLLRPAAPPQSAPDGLVALAMTLRAVRYVRGGASPSAGFDCSGFVRYVFAHAIGLRLPPTSAGQFRIGRQVPRSQLQPGDLVFFHILGRRRVSHVGIYLADGRFIHSPSVGKSVQVSSLHEAYWARHFAGARRLPEVARHG